MLGLAFALPVMAVIAVFVLVDAGRPVLFRQLRIGRFGHDFWLYKFRSMREMKGSELGRFDAGTCPRVTRSGRFLRRTKLDELPQLWNVLRGDMSLVGPRPEVRQWVEVYPERWARVLKMRPGITDPASVQFREEEEILAQSAWPEQTYRDEILPQKLDLYEKYVENRSLAGDVGILIRTIVVVMFPPSEVKADKAIIVPPAKRG